MGESTALQTSCLYSSVPSFTATEITGSVGATGDSDASYTVRRMKH